MYPLTMVRRRFIKCFPSCLQVRELHDISVGAVREPGGGGDAAADQEDGPPDAQGRQLLHGHPR